MLREFQSCQHLSQIHSVVHSGIKYCLAGGDVDKCKLNKHPLVAGKVNPFSVQKIDLATNVHQRFGNVPDVVDASAGGRRLELVEDSLTGRPILLLLIDRMPDFSVR